MSDLLNNIGVFINMILNIIVRPNTGASNTSYSLLTWLFDGTNLNTTKLPMVLMLTFGIALTGVSVGILKRFLWKN